MLALEFLKELEIFPIAFAADQEERASAGIE